MAGSIEEQRVGKGQCNDCRACRKVCPFLSACGMPDALLAKNPADAFLCTNCGACGDACSLDLNPAADLRQAKRRQIKGGSMPENVAAALENAGRFARTGHRFPFVSYPKTSAVFWPGCGLAGAAPEMVTALQRLLEKKLGEPVGIVLDCCFDSVNQLGGDDTVREACGRIRERLQRGKITRVIMGCLNCRKVFAAFLPDVRCDFALDLLAGELEVNRLPENVFLHHPCPALKFEETRKIVEERITSVRPLAKGQVLTACCGSGGGLPSLGEGLAARFSQRIMATAGHRTILTYCTGCCSRFRGQGRNALHLLGMLPGLSPVLKPVSSARYWMNRLLLSVKLQLAGGSWAASVFFVLIDAVVFGSSMG